MTSHPHFENPFSDSRRASNARQFSVPEQADPRKWRKKFILCFDGTGNKFSGTDADSNILKIYRMLDRDDSAQFHYYQPGIGTYVESSSLTHSSRFVRLKSAYLKMKDSAVGSSFGEHVMAGYKFLMRYYHVGDDIYLFGFSRGAYTARFLAEMLDHIGLLSAGNEEMTRFAWRAFQKWQQRSENTEKGKMQKKFLLNYMLAFRETFSRPVRRIRFLGLFDTVNSVPQFENAFLQRSKFPYTARSTAKVIRHAVSIDERRAKFRQDLIGELRPVKEPKYRRRHPLWDHPENKTRTDSVYKRGRNSLVVEHHDRLEVPKSSRDHSETTNPRSLGPRTSNQDPDQRSMATTASEDSLSAVRRNHFGSDDEDSDDEDDQDIQEVWFPGCHADIGGGWPLETGEDAALSFIPLVWMVREAERAGLRFDPRKVRDLNCCEDVFETQGNIPPPLIQLPEIELSNVDSPDVQTPEYSDLMPPLLDSRGHADGHDIEIVSGQPMPTAVDHQGEPAAEMSFEMEQVTASQFVRALDSAARTGKIHDVLQFGTGSSNIGVMAWNFMEYLPFRRMDLQPDGSWKSINWPLPKGEVRDIPQGAIIHNSVIKRMRADPTYRPGNIIVGGGGRGMRVAPAAYGMGKWKILKEEGDPVGEVWVRDGKPGPLNAHLE